MDDIILVRKRDINMAPVIDPYYSLLYSGMPAYVDTVMVGGRGSWRRAGFGP